jgi:hypothetical protein
MAPLLALQPAQRGQRLIEAAQLVHHLGFQHQRRRFVARIVGQRPPHPLLLSFRLAHALRGARGDQRRNPAESAGRVSLAGPLHGLPEAPLEEQAHGILEDLTGALALAPQAILLARLGKPKVSASVRSAT